MSQSSDMPKPLPRARVRNSLRPSEGPQDERPAREGSEASVTMPQRDVEALLQKISDLEQDIEILKRKCERIAAMNENLLRKTTPSGEQCDVPT